jgi:hypothetical protein
MRCLPTPRLLCSLLRSTGLPGRPNALCLRSDYGRAAMDSIDSDIPSGAHAQAFDYSQLNDQQLRSAIRFAEKHLRGVEEDHVTLLRAYRDEIDAMRRHFIDRILRQMVTASSPLSDEQRRDLHRVFERRAMDASEIAKAVRAASRGRVGHVHSLTEIEAMALLLRLDREP